MEQKNKYQKDIPQENLNEIRKDLKNKLMQAIEKGELTPEQFIEFRKYTEEVMGEVAFELEKKRAEK